MFVLNFTNKHFKIQKYFVFLLEKIKNLNNGNNNNNNNNNKVIAYNLKKKLKNEFI